MAIVPVLIGGIGLFLLGMILLTEGLKAAAGSALRGVLERLTGGPVKAFFSGAAVTALVQSSSATTLSTIGFVSAGLLTFPQAIGVIFGANVGTTSTGWLVSLLGLKLNIGTFALPFVGIGAVVRLLSSGRRASLGLAVAGFGLIFVGIDTLQDGMAALAEHIDPSRFQAHDFWGRLLLVGVGMAMTVVMQSSSAAVAATLTALHAGALRMEDAAVLVIGQNVGTTVKAALAGIGASTPARRTVMAHILFNAMTGIIAFTLLPFFLRLASLVAFIVPGEAEAAGVAAFHTAFNLLGVLLLLPFTARFARLVVRMVPERGPVLTRYLDSTVASVAPVAVEAARLTAMEIAALLARSTATFLAGDRDSRQVESEADRAAMALAETRRFLATVRSAGDVPDERDRHLSVLHALDHLESLTDSVREGDTGLSPDARIELDGLLASVEECLADFAAWAEHRADDSPVDALESLSSSLAEVRRSQRPAIMDRTAAGELSPEEALARLDELRRVDRMVYHIWRAAYHLARADSRAGAPGIGNEEPVASGVESWAKRPDAAPAARQVR